jgi:hypothetical protein
MQRSDKYSVDIQPSETSNAFPPPRNLQEACNALRLSLSIQRQRYLRSLETFSGPDIVWLREMKVGV